MKKILVPVDFSPVSARIVEHATALARAFDAKLWLLHVAAPDPDFVGFDAGPESVRQQLADRWRDEHRQIQDRAAALRAQGIDATALLVQGPTVELILSEAARLHADMIVVGSHGHGTLHKVFLGSVSEGVVREATCPVLIIPDRGA
jgi:nucleotide-binding universal stress UspA family protein